MIQRVVGLVFQKLKIVNVSFANLQFWTKGKWHQGNSWGGPNLQIGVSLDDTEGGGVSLPKAQTC